MEDGDDPIGAMIERYRLAVPAALQAKRLWLLWRFESSTEPGKKPLKVPYYTSGNRRSGQQGSVTDLGSLATFEQVLACLPSKQWSAIGLAHVPGCGLNSFDFDNCISESGQVDDSIHDALHASGTYCEISPSGRGMRMVALGDWPSIKRIHPAGYNVECFGESGFVTITGHVYCGDELAPLAPAVAATLRQWIQADDAEAQRPRSSQIEQLRGMDAAYIRLRAIGAVKRDYQDGRSSIVCPFAHEHTSGAGFSDTVYFLPRTHGYAEGHFHCLHAHCAQRTDAEFLAAIGFVAGIPGIDDKQGGGALFVDAGAFMGAWRPFEYVVKGLLQRGHLHSLTGHSNAGKTAIALALAICVAYGMPFGARRVTQGRVAYFAGENADDVRVRVIALCQALRLDPARLAAHLWLAPHTFPLARHAGAVAEQLKGLGELALLVVDTRAAYGSAEDENDNVQALTDAKAVRQLMELSGRPATLVLNHPPHGATADALRPRGGSAYINELDCNLTAWNDGGNITLHANKIRGPMFDPIRLALRQFTLMGHAQPDGDAIVSIVAEVINEQQAEELSDAERRLEDRLAQVMEEMPTGSERTWAQTLGVPRIRVHRCLLELEKAKLVRQYRRRWVLNKRKVDA